METLSLLSSSEVEKKKLVAQDTLDSSSLSQTPSVSSEDALSPVVRRTVSQKVMLLYYMNTISTLFGPSFYRDWP